MQNTTSDARFDKLIDEKRGSATKDLMCVPITLSGICLGVLEIANKNELVYSDADKKLMQAISNEIAPGIAKHIYDTKKQIAKEEWAECDNLRDNFCKPIIRSGLVMLAEICKTEKYLDD